MKKVYLHFLWAGIASSALAQPTISSAQLTPQIGAVYTIASCDYVSPGSDGPNQTWDFSNINENASDNFV